MKYIDSEKLIAEIERRINIKENLTQHPEMSDMKESLCDIIGAYQSIKSFITSLQPEQPELPRIGYAETYYQKGLHDGIIKGQIETLKGLEEIEKRKAEPVLFIKKQEQPEVDLEREIEDYYHGHLGFIIGPNDTKTIVESIARHFYELGLNARKEE